MSYTEINSKTWDVWAKNGICWSIPISHEVYEEALNGKWDVNLTPCKPVPKSWFLAYLNNGRLEGTKLLGLASGGGQQMPIFAALGADCTVLDYSGSQLNSERLVAEREGYDINIIKADMAKPLPFADDSFDVIFHPVSNCYIEDASHVWNECFRILRNGGILLAGMDNGFNFIIGDAKARPLVITNKLPFNPLKMPQNDYDRMAANNEGIQFSHTLEEQLGGQLKAGFLLTDVLEDFDNEPDAIADGIPAYWASRAIKPYRGKDGFLSIPGKTTG